MRPLEYRIIERQLDLPEADVEIIVKNDGRLWVNVAGLCFLRVKNAKVTIEKEEKNANG